MKIFNRDNSKIDPSKLRYRFYVFDVETTCLEPMAKNFVFGVVYGFKYKKVIYSVEDFRQEFTRRRYRGKFVFAHNAEFDLTTVFGNIFQELDTAAIFNGGFILAKSGGVTFADSMNLFANMSVKKIGEMSGLQKMENLKVRSEGLTRENMTGEDIEYCIQDCRIVWKALLRMFENIGQIKTTLPSLSLWDYRHNYLKADMKIDDRVYDFYESYYGGRCEAFRLGAVCADVYDINSMYPMAMKFTSFPDPQHLKRIEGPSPELLSKLMKCYEGFARVRVRHREEFFGFLPCRMKINRNEKLVFPVGEFETAVNFNELRFAVEHGAVEVLSCKYLVYGVPVESPFSGYIDQLYRQKEEATDPLNRLIYKLRMNALYGKFGQKIKYNTVYYPDFPLDEVLGLIRDGKKFEVKPFNQVRKDCFLITENDSPKHTFYSIPVYASYITSEARIYLLKHFLMNEGKNIVYCDTDSIFIEGCFVGCVGPKLGDFKKENKTIIEISGLKNYRYINENGEEKRVLKGINLNAKKETITVPGERERTVYRIKKYYKTLQSLRHNQTAGQSFELLKEIKSDYDKRLVNVYGETRPLALPLPPEVKRLIELEPQTYYEAILRFFISGGKVRRKDVIDNVTGKKSRELKLYEGIMSEDGVAMDTFNDRVPPLMAVERPEEEFAGVLSRFYTVPQMWRELRRVMIPENNEKQFAIFEDKEIPF